MKSLKHTLILCLFCAITLSLSAKVEQWDDFDNTKISTYGQKDELPMIVVVRPATLRGRAINVYIDGEYLTSLLPGAYTTERICPGKHRLRLAYTNVLTRYKEKNSGGQFFLFKPNRTYYVGIVKEGNQLRLRILSDKEAKRVNKDYDKRQTHTISRVSKKKCLKALKRIRKEKKD